MRLTIAEIASCLGIGGDYPDETIFNASIDSRDCKTGDIFICIPGERTDGHDHAAKAVASGAMAVIAQKPLPELEAPVLVVKDSVKALGALASCWREKCGAKVVCITGTAGKTTLKETIASILALKGKIAKSEKNHNNQIGLPLSILAADGNEDFWILEAGISHAGDMEELGPIASPDLAVILNVGCGHAEGLGDKGVAWHKCRLLNYLRPGGRALISMDYPSLTVECEKTGADITFFSIAANARAPYAINGADYENGIYEMNLNGNVLTARTPFSGEYGAETALAAAVASSILGVEEKLILKGLENVHLPEQRFNKFCSGKWKIIDDTYNANPLSMERMLKAAHGSWKKDRGSFALVLGAMGELGRDGPKMHRELGKLVAGLKPDAFFWKGAYADDILEGLQTGGYQRERFFPVDEPEDFIGSWNNAVNAAPGLKNGGTIIFKGSRANKLETFVKLFADHTKDGQANAL